MSESKPQPRLTRREFLASAGSAAAASRLDSTEALAQAAASEKVKTVGDVINAIVTFHNENIPDVNLLGTEAIGETFIQNKLSRFEKGQTVAESCQKDAEAVVKELRVLKSAADGLRKARVLADLYMENMKHYISLMEDMSAAVLRSQGVEVREDGAATEARRRVFQRFVVLKDKLKK